jgi:hypothetical protein
LTLAFIDHFSEKSDLYARARPTYPDAIRPFWPPQNAKLWAGYRDETLPFVPIEAPAFAIEARWTLAQLVDYAGTWSGTRRFIAQAQPGFLEHVAAVLAPAWGTSETRVVTLPLALRCGRHADSP